MYSSGVRPSGHLAARSPRVLCLIAGALLAFGWSMDGLSVRADDAPTNNSGNWKYVVPPAGDPLDHGPPRAVSLSTEKPDTMIERADYRGERQLYTQLCYGTPDSTHVIVVVDELPSGEFDLYLDANRDRIIEDRDLVAGVGPTRRAVLPTQIIQNGFSNEVTRTVVFRRGAVPELIGFATSGYLEGTLQIDSRELAARRVDGDGNGFFSDGRDRLWIDRNNDGKWDPFTEQFPFRPVLQLDGQRYALRSDAFGLSLEARELVGGGSIRLQFTTFSEATNIRDLEVMLLGEDGSAIAIRRRNQAVDVPTGRYALGTVRLHVTDDSGKPWAYVFSRSTRPEEEHWYSVADNQEVVVDPIGQVHFTARSSQWDSPIAPGDWLAVTPRLVTSDGLLLNNCGPDLRDSYSYNRHSAQLNLLSKEGKPLSTANSGFA